MIHKYFILVSFILFVEPCFRGSASAWFWSSSFKWYSYKLSSSTYSKNANKLFCSLRCTEMLNRLCEEFQHRLCTASLCANLLPSGGALVTAGIQHLFITWGASMLWCPWFARFSFFLCSVGHCSTQNQDFPLWFPLFFLSVSDFSRF